MQVRWALRRAEAKPYIPKAIIASMSLATGYDAKHHGQVMSFSCKA